MTIWPKFTRRFPPTKVKLAALRGSLVKQMLFTKVAALIMQ